MEQWKLYLLPIVIEWTGTEYFCYFMHTKVVSHKSQMPLPIEVMIELEAGHMQIESFRNRKIIYFIFDYFCCLVVTYLHFFL